jgi:hypothetical protein
MPDAHRQAAPRVHRQTIDLSAYPDLVVIYLGLRVNALTGLKTVLGLGPQIDASVAAKPDGLLLHEPVFYSLFPPNIGMRQYWRDMDSLLAFTRSEPHRTWWTQFMKNSGGTGFWHETYCMRGGMEAIYDNLPKPMGFARFAPNVEARGTRYTAMQRAGRGEGVLPSDPVVRESDLYRD